MWNDELSSDLIKGFVELGTVLVKVVDTLGLIPSLITAITAKNLVTWLFITSTGAQTLTASLAKLLVGLVSVNGVSLATFFKTTLEGFIMAAGGIRSFTATLTAAKLTLQQFLLTPAGKILLIAVAIGAVVAAVDTATLSAKEAKEATEEAMMAYESATKTLNNHHKTMKEIEKDYERLADGVDNFGNNINLTTEEYERYNEITNQIADMFPEMVAGYTDEGNAIIKLKGNVDALTEAYDAKAKAARQALLESSKEIVQNSYNASGDKTWGEDGFWASIGKTALSTLTFGLYTPTADNTQIANLKDYVNGETKKLAGTAIGGGASINDIKALLQSLKDLGADVAWHEIYSADEKALDRIIDEQRDIVQILIDDYDVTLSEAATNSRSLIEAYLENNTTFQELDDNTRSMIHQVVQNIDDEFITSFKNNKELYSWLNDYLVSGLGDLNDYEKAEIQVGFNLMTQFNNGQVSIDDYEKKIQEIIDLIDALDLDNEDEILKSFRLVFGVDDQGKYQLTAQNVAKDLLYDEYDDKVVELTKMDLELIDKLEIPDGTLLTWDELIAKLEEARQAVWSASTDFESLSKAIDDIQSAYSAMSDAVEQYNKNGYLTLDNLQALLSLEPEYLACLQMKNGQLSINQATMEAMIQTKLAEAKATVVQSTMDQLHALAARTEADAVNASSDAATNAISGLGEYANTLSGVAQQAIGAAGAVTAFNAAVAGAQANEWVDQSEIDAILASMDTQLQMIDSVSANIGSNFKNIVDPDKSSSSSGNGESALETLQKKYESKIKNLDNQITYLENEIERLEAENEGVSRSYYEEQIKLEEKKIDLYEQERAELLKLERTDEVAERLWEVEHAIQESTLRMIEFRQSIIELYDAAFAEIGEVYADKGQLYEDRKSYIEGYKELLELDGELPTVGLYESLIEQEELAKANNEDLLASQQALYDQFMNSANPFEEGSKEAEKWEEERTKQAVVMQAEMRATEKVIQDNDNAIKQLNQDLKELYLTGWEKVMDAFNNKGTYYDNQLNFIDSYINRLESLNVDVSDAVYDKLIQVQQENQQRIQESLDFATSELNTIASVHGTDSQEYFDKYHEIVEKEQEFYEGQTKILEWEQKIIENRFAEFDQLVDRINDGIDELKNVAGLISDEDVAFEDGTWTKEGLTQLGLQYQQMEIAKKKMQEYNDELAALDALYEAGAISEQTYYERQQALKDGIWDAANAYKDAEDAIIDMNEARIDMIESGLNEEANAYRELIELKKKELDADKALYTFRKNIQKQTKDIASLERRIAAMSSSTDAATIAEKTKLQAQLMEAREGLDDTYYNHAMDSQSSALDDELDAYEKSQTDYLESLRESIKATDAVIEETYQQVMTNADVVLDHINELSLEYGVTIQANLLAPWETAAITAENFKNGVGVGLSSLINEDGIVTYFGSYATNILETTFGAGSAAANSFNSNVNQYIEDIKTKLANSKGLLEADLSEPWNDAKNGAVYTFSENIKQILADAVKTAQDKYQAMKDALDKPWIDATAYNTWFTNIGDRIDDLVEEAEEAGRKIEEALDVDYPSYVGNGSSNSNNGSKDTQPTPTPTPTTTTNTETKLKRTGSLGQALGVSETALQNNRRFVDGEMYYQRILTDRDGKMSYYYYKVSEIKKAAQGSATKWEFPIGTSVYRPKYAKGTLGTKKDEWAITDEIGDELVLIPGKDGNLQYMRRGTAVIPAEISSNLMEWGKLNPNMDSIANSVQGVNLMTNVINKPELSLEFGSLLHIDNCSNEVLPSVKKLVTEELDKFSKNLNYAIKRYK